MRLQLATRKDLQFVFAEKCTFSHYITHRRQPAELHRPVTVPVTET